MDYEQQKILERQIAKCFKPFMPDEIFVFPQRTHNRTPKISGETLAHSKGLHKWAIGDGNEGTYIYARTIKEAIKRAKKRGIWKDNCYVKLIEL